MSDEYEAKQLITDLRNDFQGLYSAAKVRWDIARGRHGFKASAEGGRSIQAELEALGFPHPQPVVSREIEDAARTLVGTLSEPKYQIHIEPLADKWKSNADRLEVHDANLLLNLNGAAIRNAVHRHQAVSPYAPVVVRERQFALPERNDGESTDRYNDRVDRYRREWTAISVLVEDPTAWAFYEDGNLNLTTCAGEYEKPVLEFVQDYAEYDKGELTIDYAVELFGKQYPKLRENYAVSADRNVFHGKKIKVCVIDNGLVIQHWVEMPDSKDVTMVGEWPNPFGRCTLLPVPGVFDPSATKPEDRYIPWLLPLIQSRWNMDLTASKWESKSAERPIYAAPLDVKMQETLTNMDPAERQRYLDSLSTPRDDGSITYTAGKVEQLNAEVNQWELQVFENMRAEHDVYVPRSAFSGSEGSQGIVKSTPTSTLLRLDELESQKYGPVHANWIDHGLLKLFEMHDTYWRSGGPKQNGEEKSYAVTTGNEQRAGKETKRGQKVEMAPSDWDFGYNRYIETVDRRASTIARNIEVINLRGNINGKRFVTDEETATALGIENAEEYLVKVRAETRYSRIQQANDALTMAASVTRTARTLGIDVTPYLLNASGTPAGGQPQGSQPYQGLSGLTVNPPAQNNAPVSGAA